MKKKLGSFLSILDRVQWAKKPSHAEAGEYPINHAAYCVPLYIHCTETVWETQILSIMNAIKYKNCNVVFSQKYDGSNWYRGETAQSAAELNFTFASLIAHCKFPNCPKIQSKAIVNISGCAECAPGQPCRNFVKSQKISSCFKYRTSICRGVGCEGHLPFHINDVDVFPCLRMFTWKNIFQAMWRSSVGCLYEEHLAMPCDVQMTDIFSCHDVYRKDIFPCHGISIGRASSHAMGCL